MTTKTLDEYFRKILDIEGFSGVDPSLNGLQVDNDGAEVTKIVFAVDACMESFKRAAAAGAGMIFVHHGLFWGAARRVEGAYRERLKFLLSSNLALYAVHLPLDEHPELGNNAELARLLGLKNLERFGTCFGRKVSFKGTLDKPLTVHEAAQRIAFDSSPPAAILPFGKALNETCALISGGAAHEAEQAAEEGVDLYVTGETAHEVYHLAQESKLNIVAGGHYATEVWGVKKLAQKCAADVSIDTEFIDVPTGL
ncbi:MAG: Nif3-like dinuclear metal center hexameric protein [Spirochaetaceae bacterium]|nr:Nif3-like dinuclear metal center hexameric protein [Spirochaetaceae bacterium]